MVILFGIEKNLSSIILIMFKDFYSLLKLYFNVQSVIIDICLFYKIFRKHILVYVLHVNCFHLEGLRSIEIIFH